MTSSHKPNFKLVWKPVSNVLTLCIHMATGRCGQLRHVARVCLSIRCELKWLLRRSLFICFAMVWWTWHIRTHACRRRRRMVVLRRQLQAFYDCEDDIREIVSAIVANQIIGSTVQRWLVCVRNRSQAFTHITWSCRWISRLLQISRNVHVSLAPHASTLPFFRTSKPVSLKLFWGKPGAEQVR